jgi:molecular chaperone DnaJ
MAKQDHYEVLGVIAEAPDELIQAAFRVLAAKYHPDANPGDRQLERKWKQVHAAFEVLGNRERRKAYDELTSGPDESGPPKGVGRVSSRAGSRAPNEATVRSL